MTPPVSVVNSTTYRIGPEKGVIHIALGAVNNALWDMYARSRKMPLWKLVVDMTPVRKTLLYGLYFCEADAWQLLRRSLLTPPHSAISLMQSPKRRL